MNAVRSCLLATVVLGFLSAGAEAQPLWIDRTPDRAMSLEFVKPSFNGESNETFFTATWFLSARIAANDVLTIAGEAPFTNFGIDVEGVDGSSTIGNIYFGAELHDRGTGIFGEIGIRLPSVDEDEFAILSGALTETVDRLDAFANEAFPLLLAVNHEQHLESGLVSRVRLGTWFLIPTGDRDDSESYMVYSGQVGYSSPQLSVLAGLSGRWWVTADEGDFGETSFHQLGITAGPRFGRTNPAFHIRVPMDEDLSDAVDFIWGLSVTVDVGT